MSSFYSADELHKIGFASFGENVLISRKASIYRPEVIHMGNSVRIDDFCILSGGKEISLGNYVHISAYCAIYGGAGIHIDNFSGLSPRCTVFSESDDFGGQSMIGPFFPVEKYKPGYISAPVMLERYVQVGAHSTIFPGTTLAEGVAVGAHSLVLKNCEAWGIYAGSPVKRIKERSRQLLSYHVDQ